MEKEEPCQYDDVTLLSPFAVGAPGKRTFFLAMGEKNKWSRIWLEKEHLQALALAIEKLLSLLSEEKIALPPEDEAASLPVDMPVGLPAAELDIVQISLGFDEGKAKIEFTVQRSGSHEQKETEVCVTATLEQLRKLGSQATRVCAAGRPICEICGGPIDPTGHVCPEQN
jgi:uncharacterized repeat protein (TIGR03847 family)